MAHPVYGWAMNQNLPTGGFKAVNDCNNISNKKGMILEVNLEYIN